MTETHYRSATLKWDGKLAFTGGNEAGGPKITLDGDGVEGPSPVVSLLMAAGACAGSDVVLILEKMKVELDEFTIELRGRRNEDYPRRFNHIWMTFRLSGRGLTAQNVGRAVQLSVDKYCSVLKTLDPAMPVETEVFIVS